MSAATDGPWGAPPEAIRDEASLLDALGGTFEAKRVEAVAARGQRRRRLAIGLALAGALAAWIVLTGQLPLPFVLFGFGMVLISGWAWQDAPVRRYARLVKGTAFEAALAAIGEGWTFRPEGGFDLATLKRFGILPSYDTAKQEDLMTGPYRGLPVAIGELRLTERRGSGKNRRTVTTFHGLVVRIGLPKPHEAHTVVLRRMTSPGLFSSLERVRLEDPSFEAAFNVFSTDQVAARTLLTTSFMERLRLLSDDLKAMGRRSDGRLTAAARDDTLLILVPCTTNLFEVRRVGEPDHLRTDLDRLLTEVRDVLAIADRLRLQAD